MRRFLTLVAAVAGCLCPSGCNQARKKTGVDESAQLDQMIVALRSAYAAFNRGDIAAAVKPLDAQIEWSKPVEFPGGGTYQGREGAKQYTSQSRAAWSEVMSESEQFIRAGDRIAVSVHARFRPKNNGEWQEVPAPRLILRTTRSSPLDLELGGELTGLPPGTTRYMAREDLLALPQSAYTVNDDANFTGPTQISGVSLEMLARHFGATPQSDMVVAICDDQYRANYPRAYVAAHHPLLVLSINGEQPAGWPKDSEGHGMDMGPFLISHPKFSPSFKILSHEDEPQIPWGVVRLEFRDEKAVFNAIAPPGPHASDAAVQAGYRIAQQNCFRCHNKDNEGGTKAGRPWQVLAAWAATSPDYFTSYVHDPRSKNSQAQMPAMSGYDGKTLAALDAYFRTFAPSPPQKKGQEKEKTKEKSKS